MKTICIYHSRDLDGWMSAAIVKKWSIQGDLDIGKSKKFAGENITFLGWDYGDEIPDLSGYDKIIIVDVAFPGSIMLDLKNELIWIDHHESAINKVLEYCDEYDYDYPKGYGDTKFAACELTWKYFFPDVKMPEIVRLLGRYDCFGHKGTDEEQKVLEFQYAARGRISNYKDAYKHLISDTPQGEKFNSTLVQDMLGEGRGVYQYLCTEARQTYKKAFPVIFKADISSDKDFNREWKEYKFLCVNQERFNPVNFGIDYHKDGYDGFACFWLKAGKWHWSLYNDNGEVDCSVIVKQYDGGGHKGAAGMVIEDLTFPSRIF